jgi:hypothetical protein
MTVKIAVPKIIKPKVGSKNLFRKLKRMTDLLYPFAKGFYLARALSFPVPTRNCAADRTARGKKPRHFLLAGFTKTDRTGWKISGLFVYRQDESE